MNCKQPCPGFELRSLCPFPTMITIVVPPTGEKKIPWPFFFFLKSKTSSAELHLCRGLHPPPTNECSGYDIKQSDDEALVMLELWGMWSTFSLPLLPSPLRSGVVAPDRVLSMGQIELFDI